jgi:hypothetical protein
MITAQEAHDMANKARDVDDKVDLSIWRMTATKTVEDIIRAEASQGKWSVELVVEQRYSNNIMTKLRECKFFSYKNKLVKVDGIELATMYVSWIIPRNGGRDNYGI